MSIRRQSQRFGKLHRHGQAVDTFGVPTGESSPLAKLIEAGSKQLSKSWTFEKLEDRQMMAVDFNDPYFGFQWNLLNTGGPDIGDRQIQDIRGVPGEDINVFPAWQLGYTGEGVKVAIVSTGVQLDHPDLEANISQTLAYDALNPLNTTDPGEANMFVPEEAIGTALAGIVGAVANNDEGIVGVAYNSELVPVNLLTNAGGLNIDSVPDGAIGELFLWENQEIDIYLHAWGPNDAVNTIDGPPSNVLFALTESIRQGRGGLGNIHIFPAGNGAGDGVGAFSSPSQSTANDFAGYNGYVNSRYTIGVTSVDHDGQAANEDGTLTRYAEISPAVLVAAPTGSFSGYGIINDPTVGTGLWATDYAPNENDVNRLLLEGYNAPTDENGLDRFDIVLDPFTGVTITDRFEDPAYTSRLSGTEAAAAQVAGVVALMLEADRQANNGFSTLSYRDVQEILVRSARQNAPFEALQTGEDKGNDPPFEHPETWIVNRNEVFHEVDSFGSSPVGATDHLFSPIIDPTIDRSTGETISHNVSQWTNGAGYTVSQGRTFQGSAVGYGHGVVDAELAVKLAAQWSSTGQTLPVEETFTTFAQPTGITIPSVSVGNNMINFLVVPGRYGAAANIIQYYNEYGADDPFNNYNGPNNTGGLLSFAVPDDRSLDVEWVEVGLQLSTGNIDNLRITLISPDGVHSELNHHFDAHGSPAGEQYAIDIVNPGGNHEFLGGSPGGPGDADGGGLFYTFSSNRHWGERSDERLLYDPATGEPYQTSTNFDEFGNPFDVPTTGQWQVLFENFGPTPVVVQSYEIAWHGTPIGENTERIQGFVGVDENQDGAFNFERYIQSYQDLIPEESLQDGEGKFNRLGEVERIADKTQEQFAENVAVELWARTKAQVDAGDTQGTLVQQFVTGDDGNYYFDVVPPVSTEVDDDFDIDIVFGGGLTESQKALFEVAAARWESIIIGDLPDVMTPEGIMIDDLVIYASGEDIDGPGGILGGARFTAQRDDATRLPVAGTMAFDIADLEQQQSTGELLATILHEMGHVLGIGSLWEERGLLVGADTLDPRFIGPQAVEQFNLIFGANETGVPAEGDPATGQGTRDGHWSELVFDTELMTGFGEGGAPEQLSAVTIASLADLGYTVDLTQADPYTPPFDVFPPPNFPPLAPMPPGPLTAGLMEGDAEAATSGTDRRAVMLHPDGPTTLMPVVASSGAGGGTAVVQDDDIVEYIVRISDGEGRGLGQDDANSPNGFLQKYRREWTITNEWFQAWDHEGRAPEYERDAATGLIIPDAFDPTVPATLIGGTKFNPATDYDILVDDNGTPFDKTDDTPIPFNATTTLPDGSVTATGRIRDGVRGINFLLNPLPEETDPALTTVTLEGQVFHDRDDNGLFDGSDVGLGNVVVYIDANFNGSLDPGEKTALTNPGRDALGNPAPDLQGTYSFKFFNDADGDGDIDEKLVPLKGVQIGVDLPAGNPLMPNDRFVHGTPRSGVFSTAISPGDGVLDGFNFGLIDPPTAPGDPSDPEPDPEPDPDIPVPPSSTPGRIGGVVYEDVNSNRIRESTEQGVPGIIVYLDADNDMVRDPSETFVLTNQFGAYDISNIPPGNITVRIEVSLPYTQTAPGGTGSIFKTLLPAGNLQGLNFGVKNLATRDYGDLSGFPTLAAANGASHEIKAGLRLGARIDGELDGQPNAFGSGDDFDGEPNDDDGVTLIDASGDGDIQPGETINFRFDVVGSGQSINAWIDFNGDGDWLDPGEHVFVNAAVVPGANLTGGANPALPTLTAPAGTTTTGPIAARFRLGGAGLSFTGPADSGEVEDYLYNRSTISPLLIIPGDYDINGKVDRQDYLVWRNNFGATDIGNPADGNGDGVVNVADFTIWRDNLNATSPILSSLTTGGSAALLVEEEPLVQTVETPLATYSFDSALASAGLYSSTTEDGASPLALFSVAGAQLLPGAAELIEAIGGKVVSDGDGGSSTLASFEQTELQLALELVSLEGDAEETDVDLTSGEEARLDEDDELALDAALEDDLFVL